MKKWLKKWIFIAQYHFQDPDPDSEYGSGQFSGGMGSLAKIQIASVLRYGTYLH